MIIFSVLYPATPGAKFDADYYASVHMPLVREAFAATGYVSDQVLYGQPGPDGAPAPFVAMVHVTFESPEAMQASLNGPRGAEVTADVANYTDIAPIIQFSVPG
ncbi:EthD family reductase [Caulobacter sp. NIBR2454]|uniref:EthD family reductase n=1 Tax=Caulobacter sp. NIBR2454 TaxID=3015996 RepID=UPI0022B691D2|nr:EthD family reductase [Caulobacter sp. NIBR2454]